MRKKAAQKFWFKRKTYGWGWVPASREGWYVLAAYLFIFIIGEVFFIHYIATSPSKIGIVLYIIFVVLITGALMRICYIKGEKPKWTWGPNKEGKINLEK